MKTSSCALARVRFEWTGWKRMCCMLLSDVTISGWMSRGPRFMRIQSHCSESRASLTAGWFIGAFLSRKKAKHSYARPPPPSSARMMTVTRTHSRFALSLQSRAWFDAVECCLLLLLWRFYALLVNKGVLFCCFARVGAYMSVLLMKAHARTRRLLLLLSRIVLISMKNWFFFLFREACRGMRKRVTPRFLSVLEIDTLWVWEYIYWEVRHAPVCQPKQWLIFTLFRYFNNVLRLKHSIVYRFRGKLREIF